MLDPLQTWYNEFSKLPAVKDKKVGCNNFANWVAKMTINKMVIHNELLTYGECKFFFDKASYVKNLERLVNTTNKSKGIRDFVDAWRVMMKDPLTRFVLIPPVVFDGQTYCIAGVNILLPDIEAAAAYLILSLESMRPTTDAMKSPFPEKLRNAFKMLKPQVFGNTNPPFCNTPVIVPTIVK